MDRTAEGKTYGPVAFEVSTRRVEAFRTLFGGPPGVPPTLVTAAEFTLLPQIVGDPALALDFGRVVHGSQEYEFHRPLRLGETLTVDAQIASIREKGATAFLTIEMEMRGADGALAAVARSTMIERGSVP
jgi:acyl dehydratase